MFVGVQLLINLHANLYFHNFEDYAACIHISEPIHHKGIQLNVLIKYYTRKSIL